METDIADLRKNFHKSEFSPKADGWPQARRRKLIAHYLEGVGISKCSDSAQRNKCYIQNVMQSKLPSKYRSTEIIIYMGINLPQNNRHASYALTPNHDSQTLCDEKFYRILESLQKTDPQFSEIHLTMNDDACP